MEQRAIEGRFLCAVAPTDEPARLGIVGIPYDGAVSYRAGAAAAPPAIRAASDSIESYCPKLDLDLADGPAIVDFGDLAVDNAAGGEALVTTVRAGLSSLPSTGLLALGGDHLVALPFLERALADHPDLAILHFDAHTDLREDWEGERFSHATVIRRALDVMPATARLYSVGIRSGLREEFALARAEPRIELVDAADLPALVRRLAGRATPIYVTLDVDGLDPSALPGTGTPEPGGLPFAAVEDALVTLARGSAAVVGADLVEVAPPLDPSGVTDVVAARLARTLLFALGAGRAKTPPTPG